MKQKWVVGITLCVLVPLRAAWSDAPLETAAPTAVEVAKAQADAAEARAQAAEAKAELLKLQAGQGGVKTDATSAADAALLRQIHEGLSFHQQVMLNGIKDPIERAQKAAEFHRRNAGDFNGAGAGGRFSTGLSVEQQETLNNLDDNNARRQKESEFKAQNQMAVALDIASLLTDSQEASLRGIKDPQARLQREQNFQVQNMLEFSILLGHLNDPQFNAVANISPLQQELLNNIENDKQRQAVELLFRRRNTGLTTLPPTSGAEGSAVASPGAAPDAVTISRNTNPVAPPTPAYISYVSGIALPPGAMRFSGTTDPAGLAKTLATFAQSKHLDVLPAERLVWPVAFLNAQPTPPKGGPLSAESIRQKVAQQLRAMGYTYADQDVSRPGDKDPGGNQVKFWFLNASKPGKTLLGLYLITPQFVGLTWRYLVRANSIPANGNRNTTNPGSVRKPGDYYYQPADGSESTDDMLRRMRREREQEEQDKQAQGGSSSSSSADQAAVNNYIRDYGAPYVFSQQMGSINSGGWAGR